MYMMQPSTNIKWAVSTVSLGKHSSHTLERKIEAAATNGFRGIELVYSDLLQHAKWKTQTPLESAYQIRDFANAHSVTILNINAFKNFEGNLLVSLPDRLKMAEEWMNVAVALGTRIIQVPSMFLLESTGYEQVIISELQAFADLATQHKLEVAYEAVAFAKHNPLWQDSVRIARAVNRSNFKVCLDSFHIHARLWGDNLNDDGLLLGGDAATRDSMKEFLEQCPKELISYVQFSDASRWNLPLSMDDPAFEQLEIRDSRLLWSRIARPFPLEQLGYFPVVDIARTWLIDYGWDGWASLEGFLKETENEDCGPEVMGKRAKESVEKLMDMLQIQ